MKDISISIIVPCFNESNNIKNFYDTMIGYGGGQLENISQNSIKNFDYEIIFVDDGSTDSSIEEIKKIKALDKNIRLIKLSRNFGKEAAMLAGLKNSNKELITIMDCDLQDPPSLLYEMIDIYVKNDGKLKMIIAKRKNRIGESKFRVYFSELFYKINNLISNVKLISGVRDFRLMDREVLESIMQVNEYHRFSKGIFEFIGYEKKYLEYEYIDRNEGESKWSFLKLLSYGIGGIISFSITPLRIITFIGILIFLFASIYGSYMLISTLMFGNPVKGYTSLIVLISFFGGLQIIMIGIIGEYIGKIYEQSKNRPHYFIEYQD
ncbi:glycosyltransferase family 2 protein [Helicobacter sp. MIT 14-3879]|uniref:glycosyltransferase family 2 protein n=1 Tax=Helicobacter sp. MIT 14-3879 TaxID=2040649 RepID=UPI000E1EF17D|nr:glycosyltransferase family 2 protein [Helicobacter sp. MIT 14-3879]RDU64757.1 glycosyltransferase [Helicobacter sp. MIT 14-3879]